MTWLTNLSRRDSRLLALLLLGIAVWIGYMLIFSPLIATQSTLSADIEVARKQLGRLEAVLARVEANSTTATSSQPQATWEGASPSVIAANVQNQVQQIAQTKGITIVSISQTQSRFSEDFQTAGLILEGHGEIASFVDLFTALERHQPMLFVDNLVLRRYQSATGSTPGVRLPLATRFEIHAPHQLEGEN